MPIPLVSLLPDPPLPTDAEQVFDNKAGASLLAQQAMVPQVNAAITGINEAVGSIGSSVTAAADSATTAAEAATTATEQASLATINGAQQVALATEQADRSEDAAEQAQIAAAAAGAAAGLPALAGNGRKFLQVTPDASGVRFGEAEQAIGDVLVTARTPGNTYLQADKIYLQSAYPELFSIIGLAGGEVGKQWSILGQPAGVGGDIATDDNGVWVATQYISGAGNDIHRSVDDGVTWTPMTLRAAGATYLDSIAQDGKGNWVVGGRYSIGTSSDNGQTWIFRSGSPISSFEYTPGLDTDGAGRWIALAQSSSVHRLFLSTDNGATWAQLGGETGILRFVKCVGDSVWLGGLNGPGVKRSTDGGVTWATISATSAIYSIAKSRLTPNVLIGVGAAGTGGIRSEDNGLTWSSVDLKTTAAVSVAAGPDGVFVATGTNVMSRSVDDGRTWALVPNGIAGQGNAVALASNGTSIAGPALTRSRPSFPYDTATQFAVPKVQAPLGLKSFIKARLAP